MRVLVLLEELEEKMEGAPSVPFSGKALIDREDILEIIKEIRIQLPDEMKQAKWIKEERTKILSDAQEESERLLNKAHADMNQMMSDAHAQAMALVDQSEILKLARKKADELINESVEKSDEIKTGSFCYADEILENLEKELHRMLVTVNDNRKELDRYNPR